MPPASTLPPKTRQRPRRGGRRQRKKLPKLTIKVDPLEFSIQPPCREAEQLLRTQVYRPVEDSRQGIVLKRHAESLWSESLRYRHKQAKQAYQPESLSAPLGLLPYFVSSWRDLGGRFEIKPQQFLPGLPAPQEEDLSSSIPANPRLLEFIAENPLGLIRYAKQRSRPEEMLLQIAQAWPEVPMIVTGLNRARLEKVTVYLAEQLKLKLRDPLDPREYVVHENDQQLKLRQAGYLGATEDAGIMVGTPAEIAQCAGSRGRYRLVFCLGVENVFSWRLPKPVLEQHFIFGKVAFPQARYFGFLAENFQGTPYQQDIVRYLFGFQELWIPAHGMAPVEFRVVREKISGGPKLSPEAELLELKSQGVWQHPVRNRRIAKLARLLDSNDAAGLARQFPATASIMQDARAERVVILVETVEHALALGDHLPKWPIITGGTLFTEGLSTEQKRRLEEGRESRPKKLKRAIVTESGLPRMGKMDVLVRADAGVDLPPLTWEQKCGPCEEPGRLCLVDIHDTHHRELERWGKFRWQAYWDARWLRYSPVPVVDEVLRFQKERPSHV